MEPYCNFKYYTDVYKGKEVPETDFNSLSLRASMKIKEQTFGRADNTSGIANEAVKLCTCFLIDKTKEYDNLKETSKKQNNVKSESLGKWSKTFENKTVKELDEEFEVEAYKIIRTQLANYEDNNGTPLLYRGCYDV